MDNIFIEPKKKYYTGVGSRDTPAYILAIMSCLAGVLESSGFILRSGGAIGADNAFENGVLNPENKMTFLTAALFRHNRKNELYSQDQLINARMFISQNNIHPIWDRLPTHHKELHTRNTFQVLGVNMNEASNFTVCWTPDGAINFDDCTRKTGGTGTAIKISAYHNIPVFNLRVESHLRRILSYIKNKISTEKFDKIVGNIPNFSF